MLVQSIFSIIVHISEVYCCATRSAHFQHVICKKPSCLPRAPHTLCLAASLIFFASLTGALLSPLLLLLLLAVCGGSLVHYSVAATPAGRGPGRGRVGGLPYRLANLVSGGAGCRIGRLALATGDCYCYCDCMVDWTLVLQSFLCEGPVV